MRSAAASVGGIGRGNSPSSASGRGSGSTASVRRTSSAASAHRSSARRIRCCRSHSTSALMRSASRDSPSSARRVVSCRSEKASASAARAISKAARAWRSLAKAPLASISSSQRAPRPCARRASAARSPARVFALNVPGHGIVCETENPVSVTLGPALTGRLARSHENATIGSGIWRAASCSALAAASNAVTWRAPG